MRKRGVIAVQMGALFRELAYATQDQVEQLARVHMNAREPRVCELIRLRVLMDGTRLATVSHVRRLLLFCMWMSCVGEMVLNICMSGDTREDEWCFALCIPPSSHSKQNQ